MSGVKVYLYDCEGNELDETLTGPNGLYMFCELAAGDYSIKFILPDGFQFSPQDQGNDDTMDSDADPVTGMTVCTTLDPGEYDMTWDAGIYMPMVEEIGCRMTGGGNDEFFFEDGSVNQYTFGGQAGAPIASQPQPWGNWTHHPEEGRRRFLHLPRWNPQRTRRHRDRLDRMLGSGLVRPGAQGSGQAARLRRGGYLQEHEECPGRNRGPRGRG